MKKKLVLRVMISSLVILLSAPVFSNEDIGAGKRLIDTQEFQKILSIQSNDEKLYKLNQINVSFDESIVTFWKAASNINLYYHDLAKEQLLEAKRSNSKPVWLDDSADLRLANIEFYLWNLDAAKTMYKGIINNKEKMNSQIYQFSLERVNIINNIQNRNGLKNDRIELQTAEGFYIQHYGNSDVAISSMEKVLRELSSSSQEFLKLINEITFILPPNGFGLNKIDGLGDEYIGVEGTSYLNPTMMLHNRS